MAQVFILGAGTPTPTPLRFGTSFVVQIGAEYIMFDCGPATTHKLVKAGLFPTQINHLFFTHHHFDHNVDYPCFLLCRWDQSTGKEAQLQIYGPSPTARMTEGLIGEGGVFTPDWKARVGIPVSQRVHLNRGGSLPRPVPSVKAYDIEAGKVVKTDKWEVITTDAKHVEPWLKSLAYRINSEEGDIMIAGDTEPCEPVSELAKGVDVFIANCWDHQETMKENGEAPGQTGTIDAAKMAKSAGAKTLILAHAGQHLAAPGSREKGIKDIANIYDGRIVFAEELMTVAL